MEKKGDIMTKKEYSIKHELNNLLIVYRKYIAECERIEKEFNGIVSLHFDSYGEIEILIDGVEFWYDSAKDKLTKHKLKAEECY